MIKYKKKYKNITFILILIDIIGYCLIALIEINNRNRQPNFEMTFKMTWNNFLFLLYTECDRMVCQAGRMRLFMKK